MMKHFLQPQIENHLSYDNIKKLLADVCSTQRPLLSFILLFVKNETSAKNFLMPPLPYHGYTTASNQTVFMLK